MPRINVFVLAGGRGERLQPLTGLEIHNRPKVLVPFEKKVLLDIATSNALLSGLTRIHVLAQAHANKVNGHVQATYLGHDVGGQVRCQVPPMILGPEHFAGTYDAIRQSIFLLDDCDYVLILSGDHLYEMDYTELINEHITKHAEATVVVKRVPRAEASRFGVFTLSPNGWIAAFNEKPEEPAVIPGTDECMVSLGIYMFSTKALRRITEQIEGDDFGKHVISALVHSELFDLNMFEFSGYWMDVGTVGAYWQSNMDITGPDPLLNLYRNDWLIMHRPRHLPSPKFIDDCRVHNSIVSDGCIVAGHLSHTVAGTRVQINSGAIISESVLLDKAVVGRNVRLCHVILDKSAEIGDGMVLGENPAHEVQRYPGIELHDGIIVVPKGIKIGGDATPILKKGSCK